MGRYYLLTFFILPFSNNWSILEAKGICQGAACDTFIQSDGNYMLKYNGKTYQSINDLLKGNYDKRRIYTVEEANFVAGDRNTVTIRYR